MKKGFDELAEFWLTRIVNTKTEQKSKQEFELQFVKFINKNSGKVKALSALNLMSETEKLELIKKFIAATK